MRLDLDCVRDILLCIEENTDLHHDCHFIEVDRFDIDSNEKDFPPYQNDLQKNYDNNTLLYHVYYCINAGLIRKGMKYDDMLRISDLTPAGHEFLNNIREDNIWNGIKSVSSKVGAKSLEAVTQIASNVITELIKTHFGIR